ncbi:hypothetical protein RY27_09660, partial [Litorilinea aerophila]
PLLLLIFFNRIVGFYTDWYWYESLGFERVFVTRFLASFGLFLAGALFFWIFLALNVLLARRLAPAGLANTALDQIANALGIRITSIILGGGVLLALILGGSLSSHWEELLLYLNQAPFQVTDPVFNRDVGFFIFTLPIWQLARNWLMSVIVITLLATAFVAGVGWRTWRVRTPVLAHLSVLGALILLLIAWQYRLDAYQLVYSTRGAVFGAGYTDVKAQLPAYNILSIVTLVTAVLLVVTVYLRQAWRAIVAVLVIWVAVAILAGNFYPGLVQRFQVSPNELNLERPYIENNIQFTRQAYDLDRIEVRSYEASNNPSAESLLATPQTMHNILLWDSPPTIQ